MKEKPKSNLVRYSRHTSIKFKNGAHRKFDRRRVSFPPDITPPEIDPSEKKLLECHYPFDECEASWVYKKLS